MMIAIRHLTKCFGEVKAVNDLSLEISSGEVVVIQGPSGSGKTTLLRLIAGLELPDEGEILMDGELVSSPGWARPPYTRGIGFVFQRSALWPHMTVAQNICFSMNGISREEAASRLSELLERTALKGLSSRYPSQLSGGEARRVALARAIAARPRRLLLDEPLSNLDPELCASMLDLIWQVQAETGVTLIFVSHDPLPAGAVCKRVVVMRGGRVVQAGAWDEIETLSVRKSASASGANKAWEIGP